MFQKWRQRAGQLKTEAYAVYLACRDPRTPWYAKMLAACVAGYAFSPLDLIPDFIPVLGYLDDFVLIPLGIALVLKLIPPQVLVECRQKARAHAARLRNIAAAAVVVVIWFVVLSIPAVLIWRYWWR